MKSFGFAFSPDHSRVVLIAKNRPARQAGRLNGVGGHVKPGETPAAAMAREFREESLCEDAVLLASNLSPANAMVAHVLLLRVCSESVMPIRVTTIKKIYC
jgi:hypothetical protein